MTSPLAVTAVTAAALALSLASPAPASEPEDGPRKAAELYFQGHATGNGDFFRQAFHPDAKLFWVKDGTLSTRTSAEFAAGASGKPPADEAQRRRRIVLVDVTGDAAVVKVELDYPTVVFTDYLSMLKLGTEWKVVNKTFHARPKPKA